MLNKCTDVPNFLRSAIEALKDKGELHMASFDVEGCFPNMPVQAIKVAMLEIIQQAKRERKVDSIFVPTAKLGKCAWNSRRMKGVKWIDFGTLLDIAEFALDNTLIRKDGKIMRQVKGIPMGGPISPAFCIGTCAWMEQEWMAGLATIDKGMFKAARYADDILAFVAKSPSWDETKFLEGLTTECYFPPLSLERVESTDFLETTIQVHNGVVSWYLKNVNHIGCPAKVWRYQRFDSYATLEQKKTVMMGTLQKVNFYASNLNALFLSGMQKVAEFERLGYPAWLCKRMCARMAMASGSRVWFDIRDRVQGAC